MARILVVDDDAVSRVMLRHVLSRHDHQVIEVEDGLDALEILTGSPVDLVISDQDMPGLTGLELRQRLGSGFDVPFVLLTGFSTSEEIDGLDGFEAVDAYISKPVTIDEVLTVVGRLITPSPRRSSPRLHQLAPQ